MKHLIKITFVQILADRALLALIAGLTIGAIGYIAYVVLSIQPSDLQLAIRYTSFGETQYYRDRWFYLIGFAAFGLLFLISHTVIIAKLLISNMRHLAFAFGWLSIIVLATMYVYTYLVLQIAYLS